jgi:hypothetical protein
MQKKLLQFKMYFLVLSLSLCSNIAYSQVISSVSISSNPTDCAAVNFVVSGQLNSLSYSVVSVNHTIVNGLLTINFHYNNPFIILPALGTFTESYSIGSIPAGNYNVLVNTILGPTGNPIYSNFTTNMTVTSCCPLSPTILPIGNISNFRVCVGDTIQLAGSAPGATTFSWINSNGNPVSSDSTFSTAFFAPGVNTYTLEVGDGNCTQQTTINLTVDTIPTIDLGVDTTICDNAFLILDAGSQAPNVVYNWFNSGNSSPVLQVDTAGTYGITLTSGTCVFTDSINISVNPSPMITLGNDTTLCFGENILLDATTAGNITYQWSNLATTADVVIDSAGSYAVTVTDGNGCSNSDAISINVNPEINIGLSDSATINVAGDSMVLDAGTWVSYLWSTGETTQQITVSTSGTYSVTVTDASNCSNSDQINVMVTNTANVDIENVNIYPNPASDIVTIDAADWLHQVSSIEIYNQLGQLVQVKHGQATNQINIQDLTNGMYIIRWKSNNNETLGLAKLIKQ